MSSHRKKNSRSSQGNSPKKNLAQPMGARAAAAAGGGEEREPSANSVEVPIWLIVLFGLLVYWGQLYLDRNAGEFNPQVYGPYVSFRDVSDRHPKSGGEMLIAKGEGIYPMCGACHGGSGLGTTLGPPLAGSEWVTGPAGRLIRIPLHGLVGPITVAGKEYNFPSGMPPFGDPNIMDNEQLAAVLSYIRNAWGNTAPPILPEHIEAVRQAEQGRAKPWTAKELEQIQDE